MFDPGAQAQMNFAVPVELVDADGDATAAVLSVRLLPGGASAPPGLDLDANNSNAGGSNYSSTFTIGGPAIPIADIDVAITDPDSTTMASATISMIANGQVPPPTDFLSISGILPGGITASAYNPATGVLTLTGVASIADYEAALHQVVFSTADPLFNADRIISVTVNDGANTSNVAQDFMHVVRITQTAADVIDHPQPLDANFDTQNVAGAVTDVTVTATNDVVRAAVSGPGSPTVVPDLLHDDTSSVGKVVDVLAAPTTQEFSSGGIGVTATTQLNILGSAHGDTLDGDGSANILHGAVDIDDTLIGNADGGTLNGRAGNDKFVLQLNSGSHDTIGDFVSGVGQILVDNGSGLTIATAGTVDLANFHSGDETVAATWNGGTGKEFVFNTATHELWYSANGTGTDKIDLAHISTGVPVATDVHTFR